MNSTHRLVLEEISANQRILAIKIKETPEEIQWLINASALFKENFFMAKRPALYVVRACDCNAGSNYALTDVPQYDPQSGPNDRINFDLRTDPPEYTVKVETEKTLNPLVLTKATTPKATNSQPDDDYDDEVEEFELLIGHQSDAENVEIEVLDSNTKHPDDSLVRPFILKLKKGPTPRPRGILNPAISHPFPLRGGSMTPHRRRYPGHASINTMREFRGRRPRVRRPVGVAVDQNASWRQQTQTHNTTDLNPNVFHVKVNRRRG